ncbi:MAG: dephospho-CoA kinase [Lachnospiraceae bacterium]|nr:dephospho-CoA kinase [Lachnospiraceae bacterium]
MKVIGITGGVGAGKSALLKYIAENYNCRIILADEIAHQVKKPGTPCYDRLLELLSTDILNEDGTIHKGKMAVRIFESEELLKRVNEIIHPAVKQRILDEIADARDKGVLDFLFLEAALLIEDGYLNIVDEMWYIYAREDVRRMRLKVSRNYSDEKIDAIMKTQLSEENFRKNCSVVIDNSDSLEDAYRQIDAKLGESL